MARTPQNGRTFESFGEDPCLAGQLAVANIRAIQSQHVIANVKHFAANNQETDRFKIDEEIDERTLRELYLPAFEAAVVDGDVGSVMGAYNKINGTFCCENEMLLNQILKGDWKFAGFITSDFGAVHSTLACAMHGLDVELPTGKFWGKLKPMVESGRGTRRGDRRQAGPKIPDDDANGRLGAGVDHTYRPDHRKLQLAGSWRSRGQSCSKTARGFCPLRLMGLKRLP